MVDMIARSIAFGDPGRLEDLGEAFLLQEQHRAIAAVRTLGLDVGDGNGGVADQKIAMPFDVAPDRQRAETDLLAGVRLAEMAAVVPGDVPVGGRIRAAAHIFGQQRLGEVLRVDRRLLGQPQHLRAGRVVDLARIGGQRPVGARGHVGLAHHLIGGFGLVQRPHAARHPVGAAIARIGVADFRLALLRPAVGRFRQHVGDGPGDAHDRATEDLPLSRNCRRGVLRCTNTITGSSGPAYCALEQSIEALPVAQLAERIGADAGREVEPGHHPADAIAPPGFALALRASAASHPLMPSASVFRFGFVGETGRIGEGDLDHVGQAVMLEGVHLVVEAVLLAAGGDEALEKMLPADDPEVLRLHRARAGLHGVQQTGDQRRIGHDVGQGAAAEAQGHRRSPWSWRSRRGREIQR